jgi:tetratricopeptide (TPR) repeat protein
MSAPAPPAGGSPAPTPGARLFAGLLVVQVLALAFVLAAFPARNPDLWTHLALGRLIADGGYHFGEDPLAYTTAGVYWANHAWLFDLLLYQLYTAFGDGLVLLKGLFVVGVAAVLLSCRRPGAGLLVPALVTALALLAMSPRLLLQPSLVSVGLLAVTVRLLLRPPAPWAVYLLPAVVALWVNLDEWFLLGPLAVALVWLGERLGAPAEPRRVPTWLLVGTVAACCLGPHHVRSFSLPAELSPAVRSAFGDDPRFEHVFEPGWRLARFADPAERLTAGGVAYLALLALGAASFVMTRRAVRWDRLLLWLAFAGLSLWGVRLVAFFAAVAGPVAVLNLQDYAAARPTGPTVVRPRWRWAGRVGGALAGFVALAVCWTGWPQAPRTDARKVGWAVQPDPGLVRGAELRAGWAADARAFHLHPDSAAHAAWFAPGERCFLDHRLGLFAPVAGEYRTICRAVGVLGDPDGPFPGPAADLLRGRGVAYLVVTDADQGRLEAAFVRLNDPAAGAPLLLVAGREATFGWPAGGRPVAARPLDPGTAGFLPAGRSAPLPPPPPEPAATEPDARPRSVWGRLVSTWEAPLRPPPVRSAGADAAALYLRAFHDELVHGPGPDARRRAILTDLSAVFGCGPTAPAGPLITAGLFTRSADPDAGLPSPSAALLAVRAAREAVAADPDDAAAQLRLGQAYFALSYATREHGWADAFRPLAQLRHVQAAFALERAAALDPDRPDARGLLVRSYTDRRMLDAALSHLKEQLRVARTDPAADARDLADFVAAFEADVQNRRNEFVLRAPGSAANPVGRARTALELGLARTALDEVLLVSDAVQFGADGAKMELELLLMLGRTARLAEELESEGVRAGADRLGAFELPGSRRPGLPRVYRLPAYHWFRFLAAAGNGRYADAEAELAAVDDRLAERVAGRGRLTGRGVAFLTGIGAGLAAAPGTWPSQVLVGTDRDQLARAIADEDRADTQVRADVKALAGLIAAERGDIDRAEALFRAALRLGAAGFAAEPVCRGYLGWIAAARRNAAEQ